MSAHADDLRHFYATHLGRNKTISATDAGQKVDAALTPGRYLIHYTDLTVATTQVWIRQGTFASVVATVAAPSFPLSDGGIRAIEITVRNSSTVRSGQPVENGTDGIAVIMPTGITCTLHVTKISRDKA